MLYSELEDTMIMISHQQVKQSNNYHNKITILFQVIVEEKNKNKEDTNYLD